MIIQFIIVLIVIVRGLFIEILTIINIGLVLCVIVKCFWYMIKMVSLKNLLRGVEMKHKNIDRKVKKLMMEHHLNYGQAVWHATFGGPWDPDGEPEEPEPDLISS
jgi:hypothetical protein